ncbi:hypothetical protein DSUL_20104 [Desulfovibrionales bacterium]
MNRCYRLLARETTSLYNNKLVACSQADIRHPLSLYSANINKIRDIPLLIYEWSKSMANQAYKQITKHNKEAQCLPILPQNLHRLP